MLQVQRLSKLAVVGGLLLLLPFTALASSKDQSQDALMSKELWQQYQADFGDWLKLQSDPNSIVLWSLANYTRSQDEYGFNEIKDSLNAAIKSPLLSNSSRHLLTNFCTNAANKPTKDGHANNDTIKWCIDNSIDNQFIQHDPNNAGAYLSAFNYRNSMAPTKNHHQLIRMAAESKYYSSYYGKGVLEYNNKFNDYLQLNPYTEVQNTDFDPEILAAFLKEWGLIQGVLVHSLQTTPFLTFYNLCKTDIEEDLRKDCISISKLMLSDESNMGEYSVANIILTKLYSVGSEEYENAIQRKSAFKLQRLCLIESYKQPANKSLNLTSKRTSGLLRNLEKHGEFEAQFLAEESMYSDYPSEYNYSPADCRVLKGLDAEAAQEAIAAWKISRTP